MPRCFLGLGGNVGDVAATFANAVKQLNASPATVQVTRTSSIYRTVPIGSKAGDAYLNTIAEVETDLTPLDLLQLTQSIEDECGRKRTVHWGPRTLDIDILLYGDEIVDDPDLFVPHPHMWYRRFVLDPLAEIAPAVNFPHSNNDRFQQPTIWQLRQRLLIRPFHVVVSACKSDHRDKLVKRLQCRFPDIEFSSITTNRTTSQSAHVPTVVLNPLETDSIRGEVVDGDRNSYSLPIPDSDDGGLEFLTAVITAATDVPEIVSGPIPIAPDS